MSQQDLSEDAEVVLLLCGRFGGEKQDPVQPLSAREYGEFARWLNAQGLRPAGLLTAPGRDALSELHDERLDRNRLEFLLGRGTAMALALERWARGGLWVMWRGDSDFPKRLKGRLKHAAPPLLYGAGDRTLLESGGLAIIGSRDASQSALAYTRSVATRCASEGLGVVSGGARGVDAASMQAATDAGGRCIGVLACDLLKTSVNRQNRIGLQEGRLVLVSPFSPEAGFSAGNAMGRNRYIYTLADQALVIDSALRSGGTWEGAAENLRHGWVPLYVRSPGEGPGNAALIAAGALPFTLPMGSTDSLVELFRGGVSDTTLSDVDALRTQSPPQTSILEVIEDAAATELSPGSEQELLPAPAVLDVTLPSLQGFNGAEPVDHEVGEQSGNAPRMPDPPEVRSADAHPVGDAVACPTLDMYTDFHGKLTTLLGTALLSEDEIAVQLGLEKAQAKAWLKRACEAGAIEKLKKPVRFALVSKQLF